MGRVSLPIDVAPFWGIPRAPETKSSAKIVIAPTTDAHLPVFFTFPLSRPFRTKGSNGIFRSALKVAGLAGRSVPPHRDSCPQADRPASQLPCQTARTRRDS